MMETAFTTDYEDLLASVPAVKFADLEIVEPLGLIGAIIDTIGPGDGKSISQVWRHSVGVGVAARRLAQVCGVKGVDSELYFVAGALHDLGRVILMRKRSEQYHQTIEAALIGERESAEIEREEFGFDHAQLGADVAHQWALGPELCHLIKYHHTPDPLDDANAFDEDPNRCESTRLMRLVCVSNRCVKAMGVGYDADGCHGINSDWLIDEKMKVLDLPDLLTGLEEDTADLCALLGV